MLTFSRHTFRLQKLLRACLQTSLVGLLLFSLSACSKEGAESDAEAESVVTLDVAINDVAADGRQAMINKRVKEAAARLSSSDAGQMLWEAIEAHGGLMNWFNNGPLSFRFAYHTFASDRLIDTWQDVDKWSSRAVHRLASNPEVSFGWDGSQAWVKPGDAELKTNARFWALTPYYFVAVPFVLADEGVNLTLEDQIEFEGVTYNQVRATFSEGVGDAPDDYYIVLINPMTQRVAGVRYIVTYPGFFPDGGHSPEKLMSYDGRREVDGIVFMESLRSFKMNEDGTVGEQVTSTKFTDVKFLRDLVDSHFDMPEGAMAQAGLGAR